MPVNRDRRGFRRSTAPRRAAAPAAASARRAAGLLAALLLALAGLLLEAAPAQAAGGALSASDPDDRAQLDTAPGWVNLAFDGTVDDRVAKVLVLDADGRNVTAGPLIVENTNVTTQLRDGLPKGTYTVHYRVDGGGGQPRGGAFQFSYGPGSFTDLPDRSWSGSSQEPEVLRGDDPNGPEQPAGSDTPGIEVTSSAKNERTTQAPPPATSTTEDPDDPDPADPTTEAATEGSDDPTGSGTATAVQDDSGTGRAFLIGGIVLLAAVVGTVVGLYRRSKQGGDHS